MTSSRALLLAAIILSTSTLSTSPARAQAQTAETRARAKEAYDRGVEAHAKGDMKKAAQEFARADQLAPSQVALQAALDAAVEADDPTLVGELLERTSREKRMSPSFAASVRAARGRYGKLGKVRVQCPAGSACLATLDGTAVEVNKAVWSKPGQHTVVVQVDGESQTKLVTVTADQTSDVLATKGEPGSTPVVVPPNTSSNASSSSSSPSSSDAPGSSDFGASMSSLDPKAHRRPWDKRGLPPIFFYGGLGATAVLATMTTIFAINTSAKHTEFVDAGCDRVNGPDCETLKSDGESRQSTTNVSLVMTGLVGVATAVVGFAFTDWGSPVFGLTPGGASVAFARKF